MIHKINDNTIMPILWLAKSTQWDVYKLLDNFELLVQENTVPASYNSIEKKLFKNYSHSMVGCITVGLQGLSPKIIVSCDLSNQLLVQNYLDWNITIVEK